MTPNKTVYPSINQTINQSSNNLSIYVYIYRESLTLYCTQKSLIRSLSVCVYMCVLFDYLRYFSHSFKLFLIFVNYKSISILESIG